MAHVKDVDQQDFGTEVLQRSHDVPVVVDFWATWCGPCKTLGPALEAVAADYDGRFELVKVDVDQNQELSQQFQIQSIPTVVAFKNGQPVSQFMGAIPDPQIRQFIDNILPTELDLMVDHARDLVLEGDEVGASGVFSQVLEKQADHVEAGTGLASLLIANGDTETALIVLGRLPRTSEVEKLEAAARVTAARGADVPELEAKLALAPDDQTLRIELAQALAANGEHEAALDHLLAVVANKGDQMDEARQGMVDVFGLLGDEHPLTVSYRKALANALF
ncbi:MAG: thioredoxin [Acidimicrobiia bacterium]|jgi:putative thioredoxin